MKKINVQYFGVMPLLNQTIQKHDTNFLVNVKWFLVLYIFFKKYIMFKIQFSLLYRATPYLIGVFIDISKPLGNVVEGLGIGNIVDEHDAHGSPVVGGGDRMEPFLAYK
jgi:hypothetical protein